MKKNHWVILATTLVSLMALILSASGEQAKAAPTLPARLSIAGGPTRTGVYATTTGMATIIEKYLRIKANVAAGGMGSNLVLLRNKEVEIGVSQADLALAAVQGTYGGGQYGKIGIRLMFSGTTPRSMFLVRTASGISKVEDLKGKKVMATNNGAPTMTTCAKLILKSAGMTFKDINDIEFGNTPEQLHAVGAKKVDAGIMFLPSRGGVAWAQQMYLQDPISFITGDEKALESTISGIDYVVKATIRQKDYSYMLKNDIVTIGIPQVVICRTDVSEDVIYQVMKVIFGHQDELGTFHPEAKAFLEHPLESTVIPYHPGAVKYFKEKGLWSANLENKQNKLLQALK